MNKEPLVAGLKPTESSSATPRRHCLQLRAVARTRFSFSQFPCRVSMKFARNSTRDVP